MLREKFISEFAGFFLSDFCPAEKETLPFVYSQNFSQIPKNKVVKMEILVTDYCTDKWIFWANLSDSYVSEKTKKTGKTSDRHLTSNRAKHLRPSWVKKVEKKYRQSLEWDMLGYFSDIISKQNKCTKKMRSSRGIVLSFLSWKKERCRVAMQIPKVYKSKSFKD